MAKIYGAPLALFPPIGEFSPQRVSWEKDLLLAAVEGYVHPADPDKELTRFMVPSSVWPLNVHQPSSYCITFGSQSWRATPDAAPFIPHEISFINELYREPRSLAHLIGLSYNQFHILYCADTGEVSLANEGHQELMLLVVKEGVTVTIQDTFTGSRPGRLLVGILEQGAQVTFLSDQSIATEGYTVQHDRWYVGPQAQLTVQELVTGGRQSWLRKEFKLAEKAHLSYTWLSALKGAQQAALTTVQEHNGAASSSQVLVKAALCEQARSFYRGTIVIDHEAKGSQADQQQRALMLSPQAKTCAIPSLEVATHEVQCQHGSAAGTFSDDELWYLCSRGLSKKDAQRLLLEGFFNEPGVCRTIRLQDHLVF